MLFTHLFLLAAISSASFAQEPPPIGNFFNPPPNTIENVGFANNVVWQIGDVQTIKFTTIYLNYTIALWQQSLKEGSASLGPIIFQTDKGAVTQFDWSVGIFQMNLTDSNVFFLWLHSGTAAEQGDKKTRSITCHYFNITEKNVAPSSISRETLASTSIFPTTASTPAASNEVLPPVSKVSDPTKSGGDLSTGAQLGIGVGAGTLGLGFVSCAVVLLCHLRKKRRLLAVTKAQEPQWKEQDSGANPALSLPKKQYYYSEMDSHIEPRTTELQGNYYPKPVNSHTDGGQPERQGQYYSMPIPAQHRFVSEPVELG